MTHIIFARAVRAERDVTWTASFLNYCPLREAKLAYLGSSKVGVPRFKFLPKTHHLLIYSLFPTAVGYIQAGVQRNSAVALLCWCWTDGAAPYANFNCTV